MSPRELWLAQLRLECKGLDSRGRLTRMPGENPDDIPAIVVVRFGGAAYEIAIGPGTDDALAERAQRMSPRLFFDDPSATLMALDVEGASLEGSMTYVFTDPVEESVVCERTGREAFAVLVDGHEAAGASSSRSNDESAELWVYTDPTYRRRGYARAAAAAWANNVMATGKIAFYSHLADNQPSRAVAASLGVSHQFDLVNVTIP